MSVPIRIGNAGWAIPSSHRDVFTGTGSHLERYSRSLNAVEINSSFYREHKSVTYEKWAKATPDDFRFSLKLLRYFTQEMRMKETGTRLKEVLETSLGLGKKWEVLLVQLPPSLEFDAKVTEKFISAIQKQVSVRIVWEPRHQSWKSLRALELFADYGISKVLADPERVKLNRKQRTHVQSMIYARLHGSPVIYRSLYSKEFIETLAMRLLETKAKGKPAWCIFDNTTFGHASENALELTRLVK